MHFPAALQPTTDFPQKRIEKWEVKLSSPFA